MAITFLTNEDKTILDEQIERLDSMVDSLNNHLLSYLVDILKACVYTSDQSSAIDEFARALQSAKPVNGIETCFENGILTLSGFASTPVWSI